MQGSLHEGSVLFGCLLACLPTICVDCFFVSLFVSFVCLLVSLLSILVCLFAGCLFCFVV